MNLASSGRYRCEVSGESPSFNTVDGFGDMVVVGKFRYFVNVVINILRTFLRDWRLVNSPLTLDCCKYSEHETVFNYKCFIREKITSRGRNFPGPAGSKRNSSDIFRISASLSSAGWAVRRNHFSQVKRDGAQEAEEKWNNSSYRNRIKITLLSLCAFSK